MLNAFAFLGDRPRSSAPGGGGGGGGATGTVTLDDHSVVEDGNAFIEYQADGDVLVNSGVVETWVSGTFVASAYEIRATRLSGNTPTGTGLSAWFSLGSSRSWALNATLLTKSCQLRIEVRRASDGVVLDEALVELVAGGEGGGDL